MSLWDNRHGSNTHDGLIAWADHQQVERNTEAQEGDGELNDHAPVGTKAQSTQEADEGSEEQDPTSEVSGAAGKVEGGNTLSDENEDEHSAGKTKASKPKVSSIIVLAHAVHAAQESDGNDGGHDIEPQEGAKTLQVVGGALRGSLLSKKRSGIRANSRVSKDIGVILGNVVNVVDTNGGKTCSGNHHDEHDTNDACRLERASKVVALFANTIIVVSAAVAAIVLILMSHV